VLAVPLSRKKGIYGIVAKNKIKELPERGIGCAAFQKMGISRKSCLWKVAL